MGECNIRGIPDKASENLAYNWPAGVVRVGHMYPVGQAKGPSLEVDLIDEFSVLGRNPVGCYSNNAFCVSACMERLGRSRTSAYGGKVCWRCERRARWWIRGSEPMIQSLAEGGSKVHSYGAVYNLLGGRECDRILRCQCRIDVDPS